MSHRVPPRLSRAGQRAADVREETRPVLGGRSDLESSTSHLPRLARHHVGRSVIL